MKKIRKLTKKGQRCKKYFMILLLMLISTTGIAIVNAATPDTTPPVLKSISMKSTKKAYNVGDNVYFNINASDAVSGIEFIKIGICLYDKDFKNTGIYPCRGNDPTNRVDLNVYDFPNNSHIVLPNKLVKGKFIVEDLWMCDKRSNCASYSLNMGSGYDEKEGFFELKNYVFFNVNSDLEFNKDSQINDYSLKDLKFSKASLTPGEQLKITAVVSNTNVDYLSVDFYNEKNDTYASTELHYDSLNSNGERVFIGYLDCPYKNGTYKIDGLSMMIETDVGHANGTGVDTDKFQYTLKVSGNKNSVVKPNFKLKKIMYENKKLIAPSVYKLSLQIEDKNSLVNEAIVTVLNKNGKGQKLEEVLKLDKNGYLTGYFDIDQFTPTGEYYIYDINFGMRSSDGGWIDSDVYDVLNKNIKFKQLTLFEVIDSDFYDLITSTTDKALISKISNASNNAKIGINAVNDSIIKSEVFQAIQGTDKTIYVESNGIQWVFNGQKITTPKDIDTKITLNKIENDILKEKVGKYIDKGIIVNFKDNGELPGVALVKIKTDYVLRDYLGTANLQVYHYNGSDNQMFEEVANDISVTKDYDLQFYISHNSSFIISNRKVDEKLISNNKKDLKINEENLAQTNSKTIDNVDTKKDSNKLFTYIAYTVGGLSFVGLIVCIIVLSKRKGNRKRKQKILDNGKSVTEDVKKEKREEIDKIK